MWLRVSPLACCTESAARLQLEIPTRDIKLETVFFENREVWRKTAIHYSRKTPMFLRGFQEDGKLDFVVKVKWQKYLEASVQSIRDLELEPATDQATVLCCLCLSRPSPQSLPVPDAPGQPPAHSRAQSGTGDLLPKPLLHMNILPEESQRALGMFIFTSTLLLAYFWQRYTLHLL